MARRSRDRRPSRSDVRDTRRSDRGAAAIRSTTPRLRLGFVASAIFGLITGCSDSKPAPAVDAALTEESKAAPADGPEPSAARRPRPSKFQPVDLESSRANATSATNQTAESSAVEEQAQSVVSALQPFQILLGKWRWVTKKKFGEFPARGEDLEWVWDFRADNRHPALAAHSESHPYFRDLRLTYLTDAAVFQLTAEDPQKNVRLLRGTWTERGAPKEESDGRKLQRTYRLELAQVEPVSGDQWQLTLSQVDNNQYVIELKKRGESGKSFGPFDVVNQQRVGTSFALADSDNPGPKCIISGGLGSMSVTYRGKSYPVCCSGCAAAFNDDPERWLAKLAKDQTQKKTSSDK